MGRNSDWIIAIQYRRKQLHQLYFTRRNACTDFAIEELKDKQQLLLGTNNGLAVFDKKTGLMQLHPHLQATTVYSIRKANDEVLLGTHTGIYHYLPQDNSIVRLLPELKTK